MILALAEFNVAEAKGALLDKLLLVSKLDLVVLDVGVIKGKLVEVEGEEEDKEVEVEDEEEEDDEDEDEDEEEVEVAEEGAKIGVEGVIFDDASIGGSGGGGVDDVIELAELAAEVVSLMS